MPEEFSVVHVPDDAGQAIEAMGSKPKFWYDDVTLGRCLYKQARRGTDEDWAEKAAAELAEMLGLPHATVELAEWRGKRGTMSPSFVKRGNALVHGNEVLLQVFPEYPASKPGTGHFYRVTQHALSAVLPIMSSLSVLPPLGWAPPFSVEGAVDVFLGYLMLDAWIGNTDRHHENWAFVVDVNTEPASEARIYLAPTYDHASSLGRNVSDAKRQQRLSTNDPGFSVKAYVEKARSAFYARMGDLKPLTTFEAFAHSARRHSKPAVAWTDRLTMLDAKDIQGVFDRLPGNLISAVAVDFAMEMLVQNRQRLADLRGSL